MSRDSAELVPRAGTELVPAPGTRITHRTGAALRTHTRSARGWLRDRLTPPSADAYLAAGELALIRTRRHWIMPLLTMAKAGGTMTAATILVSILAYLAPTATLIQVGVALAAITHTAFLGWSVLQWRTDHLLVTDRRIIRVHGIITLTVDAVALSQITDTTCCQSLPGRILGYGTIRIQSAGQAPAIDRLDYIPSPAAIYRAALDHDRKGPS
ncbi:MAG: PH domain-containing protein [Actinomycetota bacterium]|nr:PH domain-containing protein [Actinomycetota bacterium]